MTTTTQKSAPGGSALSRGTRSIDLISYALLGVGSLVMLTPFLWMVSTALKTPEQVLHWPPVLVPSPPQWSNFVEFWNAPPVAGGFFRFTLNTLFVAIVCVVGETLSATFVAYGFARYRFPGRDVLFMILLATMMLPGVVTLVPTFLMFKQLGWVDTYLPLTVGAFFPGSPFYIFLARQFFLTIPAELEEAARLDGCNGIQIFWYVFLPLSRPLMVTIAVFSFTAHWKDFLGPLLYLNSPEKFTLTLGLTWFKQSIVGQGATSYHLLMAATLVVIVPILLLFFVAQRAFTEGITMTGLKD
ncbi:MAG: carbohydrate ABC transporter permease [Candidatus Riflebacteria bacterium]|nr:carbohydrate ABC transporter permease [Candidatus Riflebacteria bacterium]